MDSLALQEYHNDLKKKLVEAWDEGCAYYDYDKFYDKDLSSKVDAAWKGFFSSELGNEGLRILDVGTGTGFLSIPLAELGHEVVGVDMSEGMMSICRRKAQGKNVKIDLRNGDAEELPFDDNSFDIVVSRWVLWTLFHPEKAVNEWHRVLRPEGRAYAFETPFIGKEKGSQIKRYSARLMMSIVERRNAWSNKNGKEIKENLPLHYDYPGSFERQVKLFSDCGFADVTTSRMDEASAVSRETWGHIPLRYRLGWKWTQEWHYIRGFKI
jgi:ubiquinone/menaquinone biosynthesis C-methylase UbiE